MLITASSKRFTSLRPPSVANVDVLFSIKNASSELLHSGKKIVARNLSAPSSAERLVRLQRCRRGNRRKQSFQLPVQRLEIGADKTVGMFGDLLQIDVGAVAMARVMNF